MKRLLFSALPLFHFAQNAVAQTGQPAPGTQTINLTLASVNQPLYPVWYTIIFVTLALAAAFFMLVAIKFFRKA
jgi:succinate dehydrogenase/fumarate reductase cytochrome b subunit